MLRIGITVLFVALEVLISTTSEVSLPDLHFSLGQKIRHECGLWAGNDSLLESCCKMAGKLDLHADDASLVIIKALWVKLKEENRLNIIERLES